MQKIATRFCDHSGPLRSGSQCLLYIQYKSSQLFLLHYYYSNRLSNGRAQFICIVPSRHKMTPTRFWYPCHPLFRPRLYYGLLTLHHSQMTFGSQMVSLEKNYILPRDACSVGAPLVLLWNEIGIDVLWNRNHCIKSE